MGGWVFAKKFTHLPYICTTQIYDRFQIYGRFLNNDKYDLTNIKQIKSIVIFVYTKLILKFCYVKKRSI